jgi:hypothetical protein
MVVVTQGVTISNGAKVPPLPFLRDPKVSAIKTVRVLLYGLLLRHSA